MSIDMSSYYLQDRLRTIGEVSMLAPLPSREVVVSEEKRGIEPGKALGGVKAAHRLYTWILLRKTDLERARTFDSLYRDPNRLFIF